MLDPRNSNQVASAGISIALVAFALVAIYFVGSVILNNIWVVAGISIVGLFIAIAVKVMSDQSASH
jgi:hypothetical protein